jgi:hypothetical protein
LSSNNSSRNVWIQVVGADVGRADVGANDGEDVIVGADVGADVVGADVGADVGDVEASSPTLVVSLRPNSPPCFTRTSSRKTV